MGKAGNQEFIQPDHDDIRDNHYESYRPSIDAPLMIRAELQFYPFLIIKANFRLSLYLIKRDGAVLIIRSDFHLNISS